MLGTLCVAAGVVTGAPAPATADAVDISTSTFTAPDGKTYTATNHIVQDRRGHGIRKEWLLVWAGSEKSTGSRQDPDFLAVIDATKHSPTYGKVVNTVTMGPDTQTEPHHMQYIWHKGDKIYAGAMFTSTTFVFDATKLPRLSLAGVAPPSQTPCGSVPDAYWVLKDGTAYGTYMGGPSVSGPCTYTNGEVRVGNGFGGSPGEIVRFGPDGRTLAEIPVARPTSEGATCKNNPAMAVKTCANPHGIQVREDLNRMVTADFLEVREILGPPGPPTGDPDDYLFSRDTVRIFDISQRNNPSLVSLSRLPNGPRQEPLPLVDEPYGAMETTVTNRPEHKGAFVSTMGGGVIYYTPDITDPNPVWREVFDDTTAFKKIFPTNTPTAGADGGSWLQTSPDDRYLYHTVRAGGLFSPGEALTGMVYVLDIQKLVAAGKDTRCSIDTIEEVTQGGAEPDCPAVLGILPIRDTTNDGGGGPHWGALDNFRLGWDGYYHETTQPKRLVVANYFVAAASQDGNHKVCMVDIGHHGRLSLDTSFSDGRHDGTCVNFNRNRWPHGATSYARPHGVLFAVADKDVR
ncbi:hypothetical protein ALI144C_37610 [Actinosynnema sp. ALI-1.44]|nr:hypothetical protein ALI144C_37610 [Actinosynnema sp. ALI-1.44]